MVAAESGAERGLEKPGGFQADGTECSSDMYLNKRMTTCKIDSKLSVLKYMTLGH